jgi:hypothetical protein
MRTETFGRLIVAIRDAKVATEEVLAGFSALAKSEAQSHDGREFAAQEVEESKAVLGELEDYLKQVVKGYWESIKE